MHYRDEDGAAAVEYALMAGLIALVIIASVATFGEHVLQLFIHPDLSGSLS